MAERILLPALLRDGIGVRRLPAPCWSARVWGRCAS